MQDRSIITRQDPNITTLDMYISIQSYPILQCPKSTHFQPVRIAPTFSHCRATRRSQIADGGSSVAEITLESTFCVN